MKLLCFAAEGKERLGLKLPGGVLDLAEAGYGRSLGETIAGFASARNELEALLAKNDLPLLDESGIDYLPPALPASKLICVGLNYKLHVDEGRRGLNTDYPKDPILFSKFHNALSAHKGSVALSTNAYQYDYEAELVAVIGKGGMDIPVEKAKEHIFGYTCGNDISARDAQRLTAQWLIGKSSPGFGPVGPWIVTADELDPCSLEIRCLRGDQVVQSSNTSQMIFDVYTIVSFASRYIGLEPGDLIYTGTPHGVIMGMEPERQKWLAPGDEVTVSIENIGELTTRFVAR